MPPSSTRSSLPGVAHYPPPWTSNPRPGLGIAPRSTAGISDTLSSLSISRDGPPPGASVTHELKPKLISRFQEAVILLDSLYSLLNRPVIKRHNDVVAKRNDPVENFHSFLNRLSEVMDSRPGGSTVTAVLVQDVHHKKRYWVASNERTAGQIKETKKFLEDLLRSIGTMALGNASEIESNIDEILRKVLRFNRQRLTSYMNAFSKALNRVLQNQEARSQAPGELLDTLNDIRQSNEIPKPRGGEGEETYLTRTEKLLKDLLSRNNLEDEVLKVARPNQLDARANWSEVRHCLGRLLHYRKAVRVLMEACNEWPDLFTDFTINAIPSPKQEDSPLKRSPTAHEIIGRMTSDPQKMDRHRNLAVKFRNINDGVDSFIADRCAKGIKCKLHAEMLVFDAFWRCQAIDRRVFFKGWKYIGTSKGACLLCHYFFEGHLSGVRVRKTHGNLYLPWRFPYPIEPAPGEDGFKTACHKMVDGVLGKVREQVFRTLESGESGGRVHDSNTDMTPFMLREYIERRSELGPESSSSLSLSEGDGWEMGAEYGDSDGDRDGDGDSDSDEDGAEQVVASEFGTEDRSHDGYVVDGNLSDEGSGGETDDDESDDESDDGGGAAL